MEHPKDSPGCFVRSGYGKRMTLSTFMKTDIRVLAPERQFSCQQCGAQFQESTIGISDGTLCRDCYVISLSEMIEAHPPGHRRARRG